MTGARIDVPDDAARAAGAALEQRGGDVPPSVDRSPLARLARISALTAGLALVGVTGIQAWQVFARYVLNDSPGWTEPLALLLLNAAMSLGAASAVRSDSHFGFFVAVHAAPPKIGHALRIFADLVISAIGVTIAWFAFYLLGDGWSVRMAGAPLPQGMPFLPMGIGGSLIAVFALERLWSRRGGPVTDARGSRA